MRGLFRLGLLVFSGACPNVRSIQTRPAGFLGSLSECEAYSDWACWFSRELVRMRGLFRLGLLVFSGACPNVRPIQTGLAGFLGSLSECEAYSDWACWFSRELVRMRGLFRLGLLVFSRVCPNNHPIQIRRESKKKPYTIQCLDDAEHFCSYGW